MTALFDKAISRAMIVAFSAAALSACALESPQYPVVAETPAPAGPPAAASPAPPVPGGEDGDAATTPSSRSMAPRSTAPRSTAPRFNGPVINDEANAPPPPPVAPVTGDTLPPIDRSPPEQTAGAEPAPPPFTPAPRRAPPPPMRYIVEGDVRPARETTYKIKVEKGDTVNVLADRYRATKKALIEANKLKKPYELEIGQPIKIPTPKAYDVQAGDTLYGIARRFSTPADLLAALNDFDAGERLHPGQKIVLPLQYKDLGPLPVRGSAPVAASIAKPPSRPIQPPPPVRPTASFLPPPSEPAAPPPMASGAIVGPSGIPYRRIDAPPSIGTSRASPMATAPSYRGGYAPTYGASVYGAPSADAPPSLTDAQVTLAGRGRFAWPVRGDTLSGFGPKAGGQRNDGVDIAAQSGVAVLAAAAGDVVYAGNQVPGFGNLVLIKHEGGWVTAYAHLSRTQVKIKDHVNQGDEIGEVGQTGGVDQPELHFEIRYAPTSKDKAKPIDPMLVLPQ